MREQLQKERYDDDDENLRVIEYSSTNVSEIRDYDLCALQQILLWTCHTTFYALYQK